MKIQICISKQYYLKLLLSSLFHLVGIDEGEVKGADLVVVNQPLKSLGGWSDLQVDLCKNIKSYLVLNFCFEHTLF